MSRKFLVPVVLPADPTQPQEASTKQYVDDVITEGAGAPPGGMRAGTFWLDQTAEPPEAGGAGVTEGVGTPAGEVAPLGEFYWDTAGSALWYRQDNGLYVLVGGSGGFKFMQDTVPTATAVGQTWFNTATGQSFIWVNDGTSTQWVQFAPGGGGGSGKPRGVVAYSPNTTNFTTTSTTPVDCGMSVSWTADPTRTYRISVEFLCSSTVSNDDIGVNLTDGSGNRKQFLATPYLDPASSVTITGASIETGLSGVQTRKLMVYRAQGSGTVQVAGDPTYPRWIMVEDITYEPGVAGAAGVQHSARVYLASTKSIAHNTQVAPAWDNDNFDVGDLWNPAVPGRFTVPVSGLYLVGFTTAWYPNATGIRTTFLRKNLDNTHRTAQVHFQGTAVDIVYGNTALMQMLAGDFVECCVLQTSGAALNMGGDNSNKEGASSFWITRIGA